MTIRSRPDPPAAPAVTGSRAAPALWIGLAALAGLWAAFAFVPGMGGWGFSVLRFVAPAPGWSVWGASVLLLVPALARPLARALERADESRHLRPWLVLAWVGGAALLAWSFPDRLSFTGDFLLRQGAALEPLPPRHLFPQALPLDVALHYHLPRLLLRAGVADTAVAARLIGALEAAALAALALAFARAHRWRGPAALAAATIVLFGGWLGLFTGYGKAFSELTVLAAAITAFGTRATVAGEGLLGLGLALALALALHRSALAFLPAGALALAFGARARGLRSPRVVAALAAPALVLATLLPRIVGTLAGFDRAHHLASPEVMAGGGVWGAAFAPRHLLDLVNLVAMLAPLALLLPALLPATGSARPRGRAAWFLLALVVPQLVLLLFVHPSQGPVRDWDVFAPAGITLALLAAVAVGGIVSADPAHRWLGVSAAAAVAAPALLWLLQGADHERGIARVTALATEAPLRSEAERGLTWEFLGTSANVREQTERAADAMAEAARLTPSARVMMEWGMAEAARGQFRVARQAFEQAVARDSTQRRAWLNLVNVCMRLDDLAGAHRAAQQLVRLMPGDGPAAALLAEIERREAGRPPAGPR